MPEAPDLLREVTRLRRHAALLEGMLDMKTRELSAINGELEQRVEQRTADLCAALAAANAAGEAKRAFLSHVSHELRTPLQAINGMAEVIAATTCEPVTRERIAVVRSSGVHMLSLVEQLLDLSWLDRDEMPLDLGPTAIDELVRDVVSLLRVKAEQKGLAIECLVGELSGPVLADDMRLREVLLNFGGNAIKYTSAGTVKISVAARCDDEGCTLTWAVADTGCGMDGPTLANVFEPFFQARATYRREHGGAGLGMAISRRLIQEMQGDVWVESVPGTGTTVRFTTRHRLTAREPVAAIAAAAGDTEAELPAGVRVMVVDDQAANCQVAAAVVELLGGRAETLTDPELARISAKAGFDVLIIDYHMPRMDGCELLRALRATGVKTPALLATADATQATRAAAAAAGFEGVLHKPFDVQTARAAMARVLAAPPCTAAGVRRAMPEPEHRAQSVDARRESAPEPHCAGPALFAVDSTLARLGGHQRVLEACVMAYLDSVGEVLTRLRQRDEVRRAAHALKGSAASIGAEQLAECARCVESGDGSTLDSGELFALAERTDAALRRWLDEL